MGVNTPSGQFPFTNPRITVIAGKLNSHANKYLWNQVCASAPCSIGAMHSVDSSSLSSEGLVRLAVQLASYPTIQAVGLFEAEVDEHPGAVARPTMAS